MQGNSCQCCKKNHPHMMGTFAFGMRDGEATVTASCTGPAGTKASMLASHSVDGFDRESLMRLALGVVGRAAGLYYMDGVVNGTAYEVGMSVAQSVAGEVYDVIIERKCLCFSAFPRKRKEQEPPKNPKAPKEPKAGEVRS